MKVKELLSILNKKKQLERVAEEYYNTHYCGYMGEWANSGSEEEYKKLLSRVDEFLESEIEL